MIKFRKAESVTNNAFPLLVDSKQLPLVQTCGNGKMCIVFEGGTSGGAS